MYLVRQMPVFLYSQPLTKMSFLFKTGSVVLLQRVFQLCIFTDERRVATCGWARVCFNVLNWFDLHFTFVSLWLCVLSFLQHSFLLYPYYLPFFSFVSLWLLCIALLTSLFPPLHLLPSFLLLCELMALCLVLLTALFPPLPLLPSLSSPSIFMYMYVSVFGTYSIPSSLPLLSTSLSLLVLYLKTWGYFSLFPSLSFPFFVFFVGFWQVSE